MGELLTPGLPQQAVAAHAVSRLRAERLARSTKPFLARGGTKGARCDGCRLPPTHCMCAWRPALTTTAGFCLLMADTEPLKPSNTGWLVADVVPDTAAFSWSRTAVDPALLALLADPQWQAVVVFPAEYAAPGRVVISAISALMSPGALPAPVDAPVPVRTPAPVQAPAHAANPAMATAPKRPLFVLLDGTWAEARKMFRKSPCLDTLPVLNLAAEQLSRYRLRRSDRGDHFCTSEVAALCLALAGDTHAAHTLDAYLDVFTHRYLRAKQQLPPQPDDDAHQRLAVLAAGSAGSGQPGNMPSMAGARLAGVSVGA